MGSTQKALTIAFAATLLRTGAAVQMAADTPTFINQTNLQDADFQTLAAEKWSQAQTQTASQWKLFRPGVKTCLLRRGLGARENTYHVACAIGCISRIIPKSPYSATSKRKNPNINCLCLFDAWRLSTPTRSEKWHLICTSKGRG